MKKFRDQYMECNKNGNLIEIKNYPLTDFPKTVLVCLKYKSYCGSNVCKEERDENPRHTL